MKSLVLFLLTFALGAAIALGTRTVLHEPYATPGNAEPLLGDSDHSARPVNTICSICGMDVDPEVKPAIYKGKLVGFGCAACPPKFAKDPERYGPSALRNEVAK